MDTLAFIPQIHGVTCCAEISLRRKNAFLSSVVAPAVRAFTDRPGSAFCREAVILLFSNTTYIRDWNAITQGIPVDDAVLFFKIVKE
jgi:hypothetical protein